MKNQNQNYFILKIILISLFLTTIFACKKDKLYGDLVVDSQLLEKLYSNAEDTINVDNQNLILKAELYRDFFPGGIQKRDTRLIASIYIVNIDSSLISKKFEVKTLYVINKEQIWISNPISRESDPMPIYKMYRLSINGPEWETDIYVDVVVVIQDLSTGRINYLIARKQLIMRMV